MIMITSSSTINYLCTHITVTWLVDVGRAYTLWQSHTSPLTCNHNNTTMTGKVRAQDMSNGMSWAIGKFFYIVFIGYYLLTTTIFRSMFIRPTQMTWQVHNNTTGAQQHNGDMTTPQPQPHNNDNGWNGMRGNEAPGTVHGQGWRTSALGPARLYFLQLAKYIAFV